MKKLTSICAVALALIGSVAHADNFALDQNGGNGFVSGIFPGFTLTGADYLDTDGKAGSDTLTTYTGTISKTQSLSFAYLYTTFDVDGAAFDTAGYILNGQRHQLSPQSSDAYASFGGNTTVALHSGDKFGWYVDATDSILGVGTLTVIATNFAVSAVPEPATYGMFLAGLGAVGLMARRRRT